jgi:hypothetical protein
LMQ